MLDQAAGLWAVDPKHLPVVLTRLERVVAPGWQPRQIELGAQARFDARVPNTRSLYTLGELFVLEISGPVLGRDDFLTEALGLPTLESIARDVATAATVAPALLLLIDSVGSVAQGLDVVAQAIADVAAARPASAYVRGMGTSGAYWMAAAAGEIAGPASAMVGSVGVISSLRQQETPDGDGLVRYEVASSNARAKLIDPTTDEGRAELRRQADSQETLFVEAVARYRGVTAETVVSPEGFGAGRTFTVADALPRRMVDRIATFDQAAGDLARRAGLT